MLWPDEGSDFLLLPEKLFEEQAAMDSWLMLSQRSNYDIESQSETRLPQDQHPRVIKPALDTRNTLRQQVCCCCCTGANSPETKIWQAACETWPVVHHRARRCVPRELLELRRWRPSMNVPTFHLKTFGLISVQLACILGLMLLVD